MVRISVSQDVMNIMMRNTIKVARAVVPEDMDDREVFEVGPRNVKKGFCKSE